MDAVEQAAREREAKVARYVRSLRADLVRLGVNRTAVERMSVRELIVCNHRAARRLMATPPGDRPWPD